MNRLAFVGVGVIVAVYLILLFMGCALKIEPDTRLSFSLPKSIEQAIYHASLSPSSHNAQMWQVWVDKPQSRILVIADKKRQLTQIDPLGRESYLSLGAFVENLQQSLLSSGYEVNIYIQEEDEALNAELAVVVAYKLAQTQSISSTEPSVFHLRHTDKRPFLAQPLEAKVIHELVDISPTQIAYFDQGDKTYDYLKERSIQAYQQQASSQFKRDEQANWLRFSDHEAKEKADGLPAEQLGLSGIKKALYYLFVTRETAKGDGFAKQGMETLQKQLDSSAGFFVVSGGSDPKELIKTGMLMQSFWLSATKLNVSLQPISQILQEYPFKSQVQDELKVDLPVQMIFRAGYVNDYGRNHGVRRPLSEFVFELKR